jgi:hypothetical protein
MILMLWTIVVTVCMDSSSGSREPQRRRHPWHSSAGGGVSGPRSGAAGQVVIRRQLKRQVPAFFEKLP